MANFFVNIFGTSHLGGSVTPPQGFRIFNLHILQVESDITVVNFDMFIEFFAFPFNTLGYGTNIIAGGNGQPILTNRKSVNQPQVIHIDQMTPNIGVSPYLANCTGLPIIPPPKIPSCPLGIDPLLVTIPCPNPSDYRLFSHPFQVKTIITPSSGQFDSNWSDIKSNDNTNSVYSKFFLLPAKILIIADGCRYENNEVNIRILNNYYAKPGNSFNLYGSVDCSINPNYYPIGYDDKILVN